nr:GDCCVxC domain-containing (seleno)protein [uncultured Cupriavidus sp.]
MTAANLYSVLTCPHCGHVQRETMPTDACRFYYECLHCKVVLRPKPGDCCVFCSFGSVPCPPIQQQRACESSKPANASNAAASSVACHCGQKLRQQ